MAVSGDVDLNNADAVRSYVYRQFRSSTRMVLDLADVGFFGTAGLHMFEVLDEHARRSGARWALVCGRSVQRLLRIADPGRQVRVHTSLEGAMASLRAVA